jgi:type I restriction enzyme S subunit
VTYSHNWPELKVGDVFAVLGGGTPDTSVAAYWDGEIPWITSADLLEDGRVRPRRWITQSAVDASATNVVPPGSVIVATRVGLGKVGLASEPTAFSQDCQGLVADAKRVVPQFAAWQLRSLVEVFKGISRGTTILGVTKKQLISLPFQLPSIEDQERLVTQLDAQMTRIHAGESSLLSAAAAIRSYRTATLSELAPAGGAFPSHWRMSSVGELAERVQYGTSAKATEDPDGVAVLRMGNIVDGSLSAEKMKYLPADHDEFPQLFLQDGDLLFNRTNSSELVGKSAVYRGVPRPCSFASYLIRVQLKPGTLLPDFLAYVLNGPYGRAWIRSVVSQQVGQANVSGSKLKAFRVPVPPEDEQRELVERAQARLSLVEVAISEINTNLRRSQSLRRAVLRQALAGPVT